MIQRINKILLIKLRHHGDVLLTTPLFEALTHFYPDIKIDFLIYEECYPIIKNHPLLNQAFFVNRKWRKANFFKRCLYELKLIQKIRREKYDAVFNLTEGDRGAIYAFLSQAKIRVGVDPLGQGLVGKAKFYTHLVRPQGLMKHTVEMQLDFLRKLNLSPPYEKREVKLIYGPSDLQKAKNFIRKKTVLIHPVSRWMFKALPIETLKKVMIELIHRNYSLILTGSSDQQEIEYNHQLIQGFDSSQILNLTGQLSILELAALIDQSDVIIAVDSFPMHIAAAYKKPLIALFGPTSPIRWAPWRNPYAKIVVKGLPCQPCYRAGCEDSKISDCLITLRSEEILKSFDELSV